MKKKRREKSAKKIPRIVQSPEKECKSIAGTSKQKSTTDLLKSKTSQQSNNSVKKGLKRKACDQSMLATPAKQLNLDKIKIHKKKPSSSREEFDTSYHGMFSAHNNEGSYTVHQADDDDDF